MFVVGIVLCTCGVCDCVCFIINTVQCTTRFLTPADATAATTNVYVRTDAIKINTKKNYITFLDFYCRKAA